MANALQVMGFVLSRLFGPDGETKRRQRLGLFNSTPHLKAVEHAMLMLKMSAEVIVLVCACCLMVLYRFCFCRPKFSIQAVKEVKDAASFHKFLTGFLQLLEKLPVGDIMLIPGGWAGLTSSSTVVYLLEKNQNET